MSKKSEKQNKQYPVELPAHNHEIKRSPIVDVVQKEIYPFELANGKSSDPRFDESITEVVTTEITPDTAVQTIHEQQM